MTAFYLWTLQSAAAASDAATVWSFAKDILTVIAAAGAVGVFRMRDDVREIKHELFGRDGTNGMKSDLRKAEARVLLMEKRNEKLDTAAEIEARYEGEEKRQHLRRARDVAAQEIADAHRREA